jgi:hypothetical protein
MFLKPSGSTVVVVDSTNGLYALPISGGAPTTIDPTASYQGNPPFALTPDGQSVVYGTTSGVLRLSTIASPSPTSLDVAGHPDTVSPDGKWGTAFLGDASARVGLISLTSPGTVTPFPGADGYPSVLRFSRDSAFVFYYAPSGDGGEDDLFAYPTVGGASLFLGPAFRWDVAAGSTLVYGPYFYGPADLGYVHLGQSAPTLLVNHVDAFVLDAVGKTIVYSWTTSPGPMAGIWALPVP